MTLASVLVTVRPGAPVGKAQIDALDRQSLLAESYEIVWVVPPSESATLRYLGEIVTRRPNVSVVTSGATAALAACRGDYVVVIRSDETLYAWALSYLTDVARDHDLDTVAGRVVEPGVPVPPVAWHDRWDDLDPAQLPAQLLPAVRRSIAELDDQGRLMIIGRCGVASQRPVLRRPASAETPSGAGPAARLEVARIAWQHDRLIMDVLRPDPSEAVQAIAVLERAGDATQYLVTTESVEVDPGASSEGESGAPSPAVRVALDPRHLGAGEPLEPGVWRLRVQVGANGPARAVAWQSCLPALLGNRAYVPMSADGDWALDVGPTVRPLISGCDPALGVVHESPGGSRLVLALPDIHTVDSDQVNGQVGFGGMQVPANLVVDGAEVRLEALATGVPGSVPITAAFGPGPLRPTGLHLAVANAGGMRLTRAPRPAPAAKKKTSSSAARPVAPSSPGTGRNKAKRRPRQGVLAAVRQHVPAPLEPAVRSLARRPVFRRLYRRLTH